MQRAFSRPTRVFTACAVLLVLVAASFSSSAVAADSTTTKSYWKGKEVTSLVLSLGCYYGIRHGNELNLDPKVRLKSGSIIYTRTKGLNERLKVPFSSNIKIHRDRVYRYLRTNVGIGRVEALLYVKEGKRPRPTRCHKLTKRNIVQVYLGKGLKQDEMYDLLTTGLGFKGVNMQPSESKYEKVREEERLQGHTLHVLVKGDIEIVYSTHLSRSTAERYTGYPGRQFWTDEEIKELVFDDLRINPDYFRRAVARAFSQSEIDKITTRN